MINHCKENLEEIKEVLSRLSEEQYTYKSKTLSNATIGQHIRHILEFYIGLLDGLSKGIVNYDQRARNLELESKSDYARKLVDEVCRRITMIGKNVNLDLAGNFSTQEDQCISIKTSVYRELAYCLEHSIHHQALIKIGLMELELDHLISINWGVAPATIKYRESLEPIQ